MKKISISILIAANVLFLTGCWKRKKVDEIETTKPIKINNEESNCKSTPEISFDNNNPEYIVTEGKTIFDDNESYDINVNIIPELNNNNNINENCLNNSLINEEQNNQQEMSIIEKKKNHLQTLLFDFDRYECIKPEYENSLKGAIAQIQVHLKNNPNAHIIIEGHACNSCGSERYNLELSNKRADTIKNKIIESGEISNDKLSVFGCGTSHLIVHGSRHEQSPNRRVEIFIVNS